MAWILKWLFVRSVGVVGGVAFYIYASIQHPTLVRNVQSASAWIVDGLSARLEDQYAVWLPSLNLEASLTFLVFVLLSLLVIEGSLSVLRRLWRAIRKLAGSK